MVSFRWAPRRRLPPWVGTFGRTRRGTGQSGRLCDLRYFPQPFPRHGKGNFHQLRRKRQRGGECCWRQLARSPATHCHPHNGESRILAGCLGPPFGPPISEFVQYTLRTVSTRYLRCPPRVPSLHLPFRTFHSTCRSRVPEFLPIFMARVPSQAVRGMCPGSRNRTLSSRRIYLLAARQNSTLFSTIEHPSGNIIIAQTISSSLRQYHCSGRLSSFELYLVFPYFLDGGPQRQHPGGRRRAGLW